MKFISRLTDLFLYTSLFTACCATGLCMATERLINKAPAPFVSNLHLLVFGSALLVYNTQHIIRWRRYISGLNRQLRLWYVLFFCAGALMVVLALPRLSEDVLIASAILGVFTFTYSWPLLPFKNIKRLRDYGWLKIMVLAGVWTIVTSILPILDSNRSIKDYPFEILLRFIFIFTLCLIFDIRDMQADLKSNIDTLPNKVGIRNTYRLINMTLVFFVALSAVQYFRYPETGRIAGALITAIATRLVVGYLQRHPADKGYLILADGVMFLYAILVLLLPAHLR